MRKDTNIRIELNYNRYVGYGDEPKPVAPVLNEIKVEINGTTDDAQAIATQIARGFDTLLPNLNQP